MGGIVADKWPRGVQTEKDAVSWRGRTDDPRGGNGGDL